MAANAHTWLPYANTLLQLDGSNNKRSLLFYFNAFFDCKRKGAYVEKACALIFFRLFRANKMNLYCTLIASKLVCYFFVLKKCFPFGCAKCSSISNEMKIFGCHRRNMHVSLYQLEDIIGFVNGAIVCIVTMKCIHYSENWWNECK